MLVLYGVSYLKHISEERMKELEASGAKLEYIGDGTVRIYKERPETGEAYEQD